MTHCWSSRPCGSASPAAGHRLKVAPSPSLQLCLTQMALWWQWIWFHCANVSSLLPVCKSGFCTWRTAAALCWCALFFTSTLMWIFFNSFYFSICVFIWAGCLNSQVTLCLSLISHLLVVHWINKKRSINNRHFDLTLCELPLVLCSQFLIG